MRKTQGKYQGVAVSMRDAIKSSREETAGGWYNAYTGPLCRIYVSIQNVWLISHGRALKKRFASARRGFYFFPTSLRSYGGSFLSSRGALGSRVR